ncbi:MAG TPA: MFS transporter [Myxococcota bacterium]|nr:MFS transporter [Myxococcota bacterium]
MISPPVPSVAALPWAALSDPTFSQRRVRLTVGFLATAVAVEFFHRQMVAVAIEPLRLELGFTDTQAGAFIFAFAVGYAVFALVLGRLADRGSRRSIYALGIAVWSVATALGAAVSGFALFTLTRLAAGAAQGASGACNGPLVADYVKPERRSGAMALVAVGAAFGVVGALTGGAWAMQTFGWRGAFVWAGALGVAFSLLFAAVVREPPRGWSEGRTPQTGERPSLAEGLRVIWATPALRHTVAAAMLGNTALLAPAQWGPAFFMRAHHMALADAGIAGGVAALFAVIGGVAGGILADRAWLSDARNALRIPGMTALLAAPLCFVAFRVPGAWTSIVLLVLATGLGMMHSAPAGAVLQGLAPLRTRALISGVINALLTLAGMGLGPLLMGWLSDLFGASANGVGLARALSLTSILYAWAGVHLLLAARTLVPDLERARAADA